jgi:hypothetical protein
MTCPKCKKGKLRRQVSVFVERDADRTSLGKTGLRDKDVVVLGAGWPQSAVFCPKCGFYERLSRRKQGD